MNGTVVNTLNKNAVPSTAPSKVLGQGFDQTEVDLGHIDEMLP